MMRDRIREEIDNRRSSDRNDIEKSILAEELNRIKQCLEEKRVSGSTSMSRAEFDEVSKTVTVTKFSGKLIQRMGRTVSGKRVLFPEEVLYLMEMGSLELSHKGIPLSIVQAYSILMDDGDLSCDRYVAYSRLTKAGYTVVRHRRSSDEEDPKGSGRKLSIVYDVHLTESGFTLSKVQRPDHRLVIMRADEQAITVEELKDLRSRLKDDAPLHAAVIDGGQVTFFCLDWVVTPDIGET